jgi:hypothetical protein
MQRVSQRHGRFAEWCDGRGIGQHADVGIFHVAVFVKELQSEILGTPPQAWPETALEGGNCGGLLRDAVRPLARCTLGGFDLLDALLLRILRDPRIVCACQHFPRAAGSQMR